MYSKALDPRSCGPCCRQGFPGRKAEQAAVQDGRRERDVMDHHARRDDDLGQHLPAGRPGKFPASTPPTHTRRTWITCPTLPIFHMRRDQRHRLLRQPRLRVRAHRLARHRPFAYRAVGPVGPGDADRPLRHDRVDRRAGLVHGKVGMLGESLLAWSPVVHRLPAAPAPRPASCPGTPAPTCTGTSPGTAA